MTILNAAWLVAAILVILSVSTASTAQGSLSPADIEALRALDHQQVQDWINGDREAILESLTEDAVFIPHHGVTPKSGAELEQFWWPDNAPPFKILDYWHKVTRIEGEGDYGIVYGRQYLVFDWGDDRYTIGEGNYFIFARKVRGEWKMKYLIATDPPTHIEPRPAE